MRASGCWRTGLFIGTNRAPNPGEPPGQVSLIHAAHHRIPVLLEVVPARDGQGSDRIHVEPARNAHHTSAAGLSRRPRIPREGHRKSPKAILREHRGVPIIPRGVADVNDPCNLLDVRHLLVPGNVTGVFMIARRLGFEPRPQSRAAIGAWRHYCPRS